MAYSLLSSSDHLDNMPVLVPDLENGAQTSQDQQSSITEYKVFKRRYIGLVTLSLLNVICSWGWLSFAAISTETTTLFGFSSESPINWLSTTTLFAYIAMSPAVSYTLSRSNSVRPALFICGSLVTIGNWLRYIGTLKEIFPLLMVGQIFIGLAQPFALGSVGYFTDMWFTSSSRVTANSIASISNPLGGAIGQLVGPLMVGSDLSKIKDFMLVTAILASAISLLVLVTPGTPPIPPCPSALIPKLSLRTSIQRLVRSPLYIAIFIMFTIYVGLFNAYSTYINQIMAPYGYSSDNAGITGAILIGSGVVCCAIASPLIDKTHNFLLVIKIVLPIMSACYIALIFANTYSNQLVGPFLVSGVLGGVSFTLLPALLEWVQEQTSPVTPALSGAILWNGGNFLGAILIIILNEMKSGSNNSMRNAMILMAVLANVGMLPSWFLRNAVTNSRIDLDRTHSQSNQTETLRDSSDLESEPIIIERSSALGGYNEESHQSQTKTASESHDTTIDTTKDTKSSICTIEVVDEKKYPAVNAPSSPDCNLTVVDTTDEKQRPSSDSTFYLPSTNLTSTHTKT